MPGRAQTVGDGARLPFDLPRQSLTSSLTEVAQRGGLKLAYSAALTTGRVAPSLHGSFTPAQAIGHLLTNTGMAYRFTARDAVTITAGAGKAVAVTPAPATVELEEIDVQGSRESGLGPVRGIVAHQSVTGTKTDTPLIEVPQSVSVIPQDQIKLQKPTTLGETLRYTPGVQAEEYGGTDLRIDQYMVRGFQSSMPFLDGLSTIGRYTLLSTSIDPYGAERVEVVRGPTSVLYGQNVPGGIVDVVSKRPQATPYNEIELQGGNFGRAQQAFDLTGPVNPEGTVLYRLVGIGREGGTQVDHVDTSRYYIAPSVTVQPDSDTRFTLLTHAQHSSDGFSFQNLPAQGTLYSNPFLGRIPTSLFVGDPSFNNVTRDEDAIGYEVEHRFTPNILVRQNFRYTYLDTSIKYLGTAGLEPGTATLDRFSLAAKAHQQNVAVDTQAQFDFDTWALHHTALTGVDYLHSSDRWVEQDGSAGALNLLAPASGTTITLPAPDFATADTLSQAGVYAQDQIRWNRFTLTGGVRQDWADTTVIDLIALSKLPQSDAATTGRVGLTYELASGLSPYVSYSTSFQPTVGSTFDGTPYKPTTGEQVEGGLKYQPVGVNSFLMLSAYDLDQMNVLTVDPTHPFFNVQTGGVRVSGLEASGTLDLSDGWKAIGAYTFMDAAITKDNSGNIGHRPQDVPRDMASLWADKTFVGGLLDGFGLGGGVRFVGQRYGDNANTLSIPSDFFFDAQIHYDYKGWRASINANNLLDKTYVATCASENFCYYGQRRTILGSLSYHW